MRANLRQDINVFPAVPAAKFFVMFRDVFGIGPSRVFGLIGVTPKPVNMRPKVFKHSNSLLIGSRLGRVRPKIAIGSFNVTLAPTILGHFPPRKY
jgi:hypothetical protein